MESKIKRVSLKVLSILAIVAMLCCGFFLTGCKDKDDNKTQSNTSTISLSEAKTIIVNALKIDGTQTMTYAQSENISSAEQGNRDILEKLGIMEIVSDSTSYDYDTNSLDQETNSQGYFSYQNYNFVEYSLIQNSTVVISVENHLNSVYQEYSMDGQNAYVNENNNISLIQLIDGNYGYWNTYGNANIGIMKGLFTDKAFEMAYSNEVIKNKTDMGYSLKLTLDEKGYTRLMTLDSMTDEEFEVYWLEYKSIFEQADAGYNNKINVVINFDNNEDIIDVSMLADYVYTTISDYSTKNYKIISSFTIKKYAGEITEPDWVTDYLAND